ncbi:PqqD family protein [Hoeflea sp. CAU 1731]
MAHNDNASYQPAGSILIQEVEDGAVLLDTEKGFYYGLDEIGVRIWSLVEKGKTFSEICNEIQAAYDVTGETVRTDVASLIRDMCDKSIVTDV